MEARHRSGISCCYAADITGGSTKTAGRCTATRSARSSSSRRAGRRWVRCRGLVRWRERARCRQRASCRDRALRRSPTKSRRPHQSPSAPPCHRPTPEGSRPTPHNVSSNATECGGLRRTHRTQLQLGDTIATCPGPPRRRRGRRWMRGMRTTTRQPSVPVCVIGTGRTLGLDLYERVDGHCDHVL